MTAIRNRRLIDEHVRLALDDHTRLDNAERHTHGPWITIGDTDMPPFLNGFTAPGGTLQSLRFRELVGGGYEPQGTVSGGGIGLVVCNLAGWVDPPDAELRYAASDNAGAFVVLRITAALDVIFGI